MSRSEFRSVRRRRAAALLPGAAIILWALADLVAGRYGRLADLNAGFFSHIVDHVQPIGWTLLAVLVPYLLAVKPKPKRTGAVVALFTGPVLSPLLFGAGGWRLWQIAVMAGLVLWIETWSEPRQRRVTRAIQEQEYAEEAPSAYEPEEFSSSLQAISGASFQSRSSS